MGLFSQPSMELKFGEPVHQMVVRAFLCGAIRFKKDILYETKYHFVGPHGIIYRGTDETWKRCLRSKESAQGIAQLCEEIQADFNERIAALSASREYAQSNAKVPPLFVSARKSATA